MLKNKCLALSLALLLCASGCSSTEEFTPATENWQLMVGKEVTYKTAEAYIGDYGKSKSASGSLYFPNTVSLTYGQQGACLEEIFVANGDTVAAGDVIATFTIPASAIDLEEQKLSYSRKKAEIHREKLQWEEKIAEKQQQIASASEDEVLRLELQLMQSKYQQYLADANADLAALEKKISALSDDLQIKELVAPFDGVIKNVCYLKKGDEATGKEIAVLYDPTDFLIKIEDPSGLFRYNTAVSVQTGARTATVTYTGTVISSDDILSFPMQYTYIRLEDETVTADDFTQSITAFTRSTALEGVLLVPRAAVVNENGKRYVSILSDDGAVHKRYVIAGEMSNETAVILDGLTEGQKVILY